MAKIFAKVESKFCQIPNKLSKMDKHFLFLPKWVQNFAECGHTGPTTNYLRILIFQKCVPKVIVSLWTFQFISSLSRVHQGDKTSSVANLINILLP